jgi:intein/homing endonuclease
VDLSSVSNRQARYKEYERLRSVAEIETALTIFADEMCVAGDTKVATPFGFIPIKELAEKKKLGERFLVYCYDFSKRDYTLGWGHSAAKGENGNDDHGRPGQRERFTCTPDHRVLLRSGEWRMAGELKPDDELMPFYRKPANQALTKIKHNQFPRIFTFNDGWKHERQFIDEWRINRRIPKYERINKTIRAIQAGLKCNQICEHIDTDWQSITDFMRNEGFTYNEMKVLREEPDRRVIVGIFPDEEMDVYDLSVDRHENFCTDNVVLHNCQTGENNRMFEVRCEDDDVKDEAQFLLHEVLDTDEWMWSEAKSLCLYGDRFWEIVISEDNPKAGIVKVQSLPPDSVYRIETTKGKLLEFQQAKEGPDYQSLARVEVTKATEAELAQATALRFAPEQIVHVKIGDDRKTFYPYGISVVEAARGPAHQLRLMEDAMVVYRLCVIGSTRVRTANGWSYMQDIVPGDKVWTLDRSMTLVPSTVAHHVNNGKKPVYRVRSSHTEVTGTATHPVLVRDKESGVVGYVDILDLKPNQHQVVNVVRDEATPKMIERFQTERHARLTAKQREQYRSGVYINKKELIEQSLVECGLDVTKANVQKGWGFFVHHDSFAVPLPLAEALCCNFNLDKDKLLVHNKGERNPERINLPEVVSEEFARLFGFLFGDGCINYNGRMAKLLFSTGEHSDINDRYSTLLKKFFGHAEFRQDKRKRDGIGEWCVSSSTVCDILTNLGYVGKAKTKRVPGWLFGERKEIRKAFVLGFADADGTKRGYNDRNWNTTIRLHNEDLINDLKELWSSVGLCSGKIKHRAVPPRTIDGKRCNSGDCWEVRLWDKELPQFDDVKSIEYVGEEDVYDITVDHGEHNFVANGIIVHNTRAPERRVFYIDVGQLPPFKAEAFIERMKDQFRKKKVHTNKGGGMGASSVEERWHAPSADEDYWLPIRPNSGTKIETLPGAQNLGEIDDALYFRNKLFIALNFPKNYAAQESDSQQTRITLSRRT